VEPPSESGRTARLSLAAGVAIIGVLVVGVLVFGVFGVPGNGVGLQPASAKPARVTQAATAPVAPQDLPVGKAVVLGLVEGITEFLPISSTGHLLVGERLMDLPKTKELDAYTIIIQAGAILAVLLVSWRRVLQVLQGAVGKNEAGRKLLFALMVAFVPAAFIGKVLGDKVEEKLLKPGAVAAAWIVGGIVILGFARWRRGAHAMKGLALETLTLKQAAIIGCAQAVALWPGVSRSFVTILAGVLVGLSLAAAVEFSFLLGLATLTAATGYEVLRHGGAVKDAFGLGAPAVGIVVAFVAAAIAVKWMIGYLNKHDLSVFGIYRILAGVATLGLLASHTI
jgi:undecaprenyl-diphosphatase